jgi:hypothetical protein
MAVGSCLKQRLVGVIAYFHIQIFIALCYDYRQGILHIQAPGL